jgi:D-xylose 1-dehydrogenase (NADP+, D-xylono-1,5-lactone-forming)
VAVQWGILSTASINDKFLAGLAESETCQALAVGSRDTARAEAYAREHGIERAYGSYEELLADPDVEAVYISLPNALHLPWTRRALKAGKHVLCEKPLSRSPDEVRAAFDVAEREGRLLMEAFMFRHNPQTARLAQLVRGGAVGRLRLIRSSFSFFIHDPADVRLGAELAGGALMDVGCYCVSGARLLAGEPTSALGWELIGGDGVDVAFVGTLRFPDHVYAQFDAGFVFADRHHLEVVGEEASLFLADPWHGRTPVIELRRDHRVLERIEPEPVNSYRLEAENLAAAIRGEGAPLLGRDDAVGQARAIQGLYAAADTGRAVELGDL